MHFLQGHQSHSVPFFICPKFVKLISREKNPSSKDFFVNNFFFEKSSIFFLAVFHLGDSVPPLINIIALIIFFPFFRQSCKSAWSQLRLSPMFGCICPNKGRKNATCDQVFKAVNGNPCIGK